MNYAPVVKLSSFGKGKDSDVANIRYISRFDTLFDETNNYIKREERERLNAVKERLELCTNLSKTSFRVIVSLPMYNTDKARQETIDEVRNRYSSFLYAYHTTNDKNDIQPHLHITIFNDSKNHRLRDFNEIFNLRNSIAQRFKANNISFNNSKENIKNNDTQSEIHIRQREEKLWKDDIRNAVKNSLNNAKNIDEFKDLLSKYNVRISRETASTLTLSDVENRKVRLSKLFVNMKTLKDVESYISNNNRRKEKMETQKERLLEREKAFVVELDKHIEKLLKNGYSAESTQHRVEKIISHRSDSDDSITERYDALKRQQEALKNDKEKMYDELREKRQRDYEQSRKQKEAEYQQKQEENSKNRLLQSALQSRNPITAIAAIIVLYIKSKQKQVQEQKQKDAMNDEIKKMMSGIDNDSDVLNPKPVQRQQPQQRNNDFNNQSNNGIRR